MKTRILASLCIAAAFAGPAFAQQSGPLAMARDLYASARYDEALAVLNALQPTGGVPERKSIEQYRSLCLLALGRGPEAETAIAAVVTVDPLFLPGEAEASPRVRAAFSEVRQRLLPEIATARYAAAKRAFDAKQFAAAERQFKDLLSLMDDPQMSGRLSDLRVLAAGFLELSTAAAAPPTPAPKKEEPAAPAPAAPALVAPSASHIWGADEPGVVAAVPIKQEMPRVQAGIAHQARNGLFEVIIDEQGRVTGITIRASVHRMYDPLVMSAATEWRYRPATVNGVPVKSKKLIQIKVEGR